MRRFLWQLFIILFASRLWALPTYTVGVENIDLSPIYSVNLETQTYQGIVRDILDRFALAEKIQFRYVPLPIRRFQQEYWGGHLDFAFPDNHQWNREQKEKLKISYSDPVLSFQDTVLMPPQKLGRGLDNLKVLGTVRGYTLWKFQHRIDRKKLRVVMAPSPESLVQMALAGHVEAINLPLQIANFNLQKQHRAGALLPDPTLMPIETSSYYLSSLQHPEIIIKFNQYLKREAATIRQMKKAQGF